MSKASVVLTAAAIAALSAAAWLSNAAEPLVVEDVKTISATVESIDVNNRLMFVRDSDGRSVVIEVPQEMRDLAQIKVGDKLAMRYREAVALIITPKRARADLGEVDPPADISRAAPEAESALVSSYQKVTSAFIQSVDKATHSVAYKDENGFSRNMEIKNPKMQKIVDTLKEGDQVQITYTEATAVSIEPER